ncbi:unnamed protein product [Rotaria sordida]|uniref:Uncharacterized protein n=1 Tax=Rotaria sordida TaxID=392033 RepID=A0A819KR68_9BILA|nr:unnamed protein product [Rotaria sordida]CAF3950938.1 unnamed protein product [Rotaria sordida]
MQQLRIFLIILSLILTNVIYGQVDPQLCPSGPITNSDPNWRPIPNRFEIMTELISGNEMMELSQAFSNNRDAIMINSRVGPLQFYWYFDTNEQFEVITAVVNQQPVSVCVRQVIGPTSETSVIQPNTLFLKPSVLLGYDHRNQINSSWGNQYIGNEIIRSVPTNKFKSCFYVSDIRATVSATYYISDATKFQANLPANASMILRIDVQIKAQNGRQEAYTYNVFRYTPYPSRQEERQALETPEGVYCVNRISTLPVPQNIPERASSNSEVLIKQMNNSIISSHGLYDTEFRFSRFDIWLPDPLGGPNWLHYTEIHDFATGLSYQYNHTTRQCSIRDINTASNDAVIVDGKPNLVQMGSTEHLFLMDDITYQYTGEKQCRDRVRCRVWIGEKSLPNNTIQHREWYWASSINNIYLDTSFPVKMNLKTYVNGVPTIEFETTIFNFRRNPNTAFDIDYTMAECYRAMGPEEKFNLGVISFTIANDKEYPVHKNIDYLRYTIGQTLTNVLQVRSIRISNILVDHDGKDLPVTFTLLDSPPRLGPVEFPLQEPSLTTAIERLRSVIDADGLSFRAKYNTTEITLRARIRSLQVIHTSLDQNTTQCINKTFGQGQNPNECPPTTTVQNQDLNQNIEIVYKSSGPLITGFWIGFIILGVLIGTVGSFFVLKRFFGR